MGWTPEERKANIEKAELFTHKYEPEMLSIAQEIIERGGTLAEVAGRLGVTRRTLHRWQEVGSPHYQEDFATMVTKAREVQEGLFDRIGFEQLETPDRSFNPVLYQMIGRRRYQWSEHRHIDLSGIEKCKTYQEKMDFMLAKAAKNPVSAQELQMLTNAIGAMAKVAEIDDIKLQLEQLKEDVKHG